MTFSFEFCTFSTSACVIESFASFIPSIILMLITPFCLRKVWRNRGKKEIIINKNVGKMQIVEISLICLMIILPMVYLLVSFAKHNRQYPYPLIFLIECLLFSANWCVVLYISREEQINDGAVSLLNLSFWVAFLFFLILKLCVSDVLRFKEGDRKGDSKGFEPEAAIYYATIVLNANMILIATCLRRRVQSINAFQANEKQSEYPLLKDKNEREYEEEGFFTPSINNEKIKNGETKIQLLSNDLPNTLVRVSDSSKTRSEVDNKYDDFGIEFIEVYNSSFLDRMDIEVRVYWIRYKRNGLSCETKRSLMEFRTLFEEIREIFISETLPEFPSQENDEPPFKNSAILFETRQAYFHNLLNHLVQRRLINKNVKIFLKSNEDLPFYGRIDKIHTIVSTSVLESISSFNENRSFASSKKSRENCENQLTIAVDIFDARKEESEIGTFHVFYYIRVYVPDGGWEKVLRKRFSEFKALHKELLQFSDSQNMSLPGLPVVNILSPTKNKFEAGLISHRRASLQNYLLNILNDCRVYSSQVVIDFIEFDLTTLSADLRDTS